MMGGYHQLRPGAPCGARPGGGRRGSPLPHIAAAMRLPTFSAASTRGAQNSSAKSVTGCPGVLGPLSVFAGSM